MPAVQSRRESHFSPWLCKKEVVEEVKEDRIYRIWPGRLAGEEEWMENVGGATSWPRWKTTRMRFFSRPASGEDDEELNELVLVGKGV